MTPDQAIDHLFQMSREAPRPAPFHDTSAECVKLLRTLLGELDSAMSRIAELELHTEDEPNRRRWERLTGLAPVSNVSPE